MASLGKLLVELSAETAAFRSDLGRASRVMDNYSRRMEASGKRVDAMFGRMSKAAKGFAAILTTGLIGQQINRSFDFADTIGKAAARVGLSVEAYQELSFAFQQGGASAREFDLAIQRLSRRVGEFQQTGAGAAKLALEGFGFTQASIAGEDFEEIIRRISDGLEEMTDQQERLALTQKLVDSEGVKLLGTFQKGSEEIEKLREQARRLNLVLGRDTVADAERAKDALNILATSVRVTLTKAFVNVAPAIVGLVRLFETAIPRMADLTARLFGSVLPVTLKGTESAISAQMAKIIQLQEEYDRLTRKIEAAAKSGAEEAEKAAAATGTAGIIPQSAFGPGLVGGGLADRTRLRELQDELRGAEELLNKLYEQRDAYLETKDALSKLANLESLRLFNAEQTEGMEEHAEAAAKGYEMASFNMDALQEKVPKVVKDTRALDSAASSLGFTFSSAFEDAIVEGEDLRLVLQGILKDIARIVLRLTVTQPLAEGISGLVSDFGTNSSGVGATNSYPRFFDGFARRAMGGPVTAGQAYVVGERGPEMFIPRQSGMIEAHGAGSSVNITLNAIDTQSGVQFLSENRRMIAGIVRDAYGRRGQRVDL